MFVYIPLQVRLITVFGFMALISSCVTTTKATEGTSETIHTTSDGSTEFTSSTSPGDKDDESKTQNINLFAAVNLDRLREDIARGNGEHLAAFAHLLGIKQTRQTEFFAFAKHNYPILFSSEPTTSEDLLARLNTELEADPTWRQ